jgi:hypothetical protein
MVLLYGTIQIVPVNGTLIDWNIVQMGQIFNSGNKDRVHCWKINNANPTVTTPLKK